MATTRVAQDSNSGLVSWDAQGSGQGLEGMWQCLLQDAHRCAKWRALCSEHADVCLPACCVLLLFAGCAPALHNDEGEWCDLQHGSADLEA
jgi:hypothetical protein